MKPFGVYVHVPYCAARCGYCDFNTYVADAGQRATFAAAAIAEIRLRAVESRVDRDSRGEVDFRRAPVGPAGTVFFGGGTPTLLDADDLGAILRAIGDEIGLVDDAEVTVEANPESVDRAKLEALRGHGATRISFGVQSAAPHVLRILDRRHTPGRALQAMRDARAAGFEHVSADLIYGAPGETDDDWRASLHAALDGEPDHVSAYGLTVEPGTRLHRQVARGEVLPPDPDAMADRYVIAETTLNGAGLRWYELSNWAAAPAARCRHNVGYWSGGEWLGIGPGAHGYVDGVRSWNVLKPTDHARRVHAGELPIAGSETLGPAELHTERVMLGLRSAEGLALHTHEGAVARRLAAEGLLADEPLRARRRAVLTLRGRLLADHAIRELLDPVPAVA